ncbi:serine/threonine-protein kinase unc-51-like [Stegodyphus dumicola]|uniref:serine/threonine-protein kinase unc-51-like n=1 Tax=Stegodyphus dumicola TaxID=202533 RepID=UPI0015AACABE|nr:serine/threonine-protein kinase unc-51-like [Stegodyphus dumicola]
MDYTQRSQNIYANHDHVVAIKCVPKGKLGKSQPLIGKEIKILQELTKLQHKNVVALLECVDSPKNLYIVIEYCNGGDLSEYLNAKGSLSEDTIRLFLRQIAEAMKVLNQKEVVHRDLKPQNILLCHSGKPNPLPSEITLKIADFGFARFLTDGVMAATLCGSPMYMAPEVIMSLKYDAKADLWSIGTIVYQCLTGKAPFMAPNPQQLKHFYEKNANLAPSIPSGTSQELTDLLIRLMKRDAKDRMDFDELFNHPFLKAVPRSSSPVPVPTRRSVSPKVSPSSPSSPYGSPAPQSWDREVGGEDMAQSSSSLSPSPINNSNMYTNSEQRYSPPSPIEQGFVVVPPNLPEETRYGEMNKNSSLKHHLSDPNVSPSKMPVTNSAFKKSTHNTNINLATKAVKYQMMHVTSEEQPHTSSMQISETGSDNHVAPTNVLVDAVPVPTQKVAYEQIEHSLQNTPASSPQEGFDLSKKILSPGTSPTSPKESAPAFSDRTRRDSVNSGGSDTFRIADISSFTPPTVQFTIGTPPAGGRIRSFSGSTPPPGSGRQTPTSWRHQATPPQAFSGSPLRRSGSTPPLNCCMPSNSVSPIPCRELRRCDPYHCRNEHGAFRALDFRNNSTCPLRATFGAGRAMTLPEFNTKDIWPSGTIPETEDMNFLQRSGSSGKLSENGVLLGPYGLSSGSSQSPPHPPLMAYNTQQQRYFYNPNTCQHRCCCGGQGSPGRIRRNSFAGGMCVDSSPTAHFFSHGTSPSSMEGHFIPPELPEETLLEKEHNDTLAKLNFVSALVKCILELAKTRSSPLSSALTSSITQTETSDQAMGDGYRRAVQLLLYMKALQLISSAFQLSQQQVRNGHLQPSTSVRNVLHLMKEHYHFCLSMCKSLNTPGLLQSVGVDPATSEITADKILYNYAIEMCQSAALEELFGEPKESFHRYQTAQILLHSLGQQVNDLRDKELLHKYRDAVQRRLEIPTNNRSVYAYHTT